MSRRMVFVATFLFPFFAAYLVAGAGSACASGFALLEQSAKELGSAFAGGAAAAEDAATIFFNPAGLSRLPGSELVAGGSVIFPVARFKNSGSQHAAGFPLIGGNGGNGAHTVAVPHLYLSHQVADRLHLGLGIYSPFGLSTEYDSTWVGRYHAVKSELVTLNINPCVSYRVNDSLSIGAGIDVQYAHANLSNAIDFGTIFFGVPGFSPQGNDGAVTLRGDSWSWGYNAGILYRVAPTTRVGIAYRSDIDHTIEGDARFSGTPSFNPSGAFVDTTAKADLTFPDSASFSVWHDFTENLAATADFTWTHWGTLNELRVKFANPAQPDTVTTTRWDNTWRYALGVVYAPRPWTLRTGVAFDQSPVPRGAFRTPRIPDNDRIWVAGGIGYRFNDNLSLDLGYAHIFVRDPVIDKTATGEDQLRGALRGGYDARVDIATLQVAWHF